MTILKAMGFATEEENKVIKELVDLVSSKPDEKDELDDLQMNAHNCLHNDNYLPEKNTPHITIAISRDQEKIRRIKSAIEKDFEPFVLRVKSLGLYKIWPGELVKEYNL